MAFNNSTDDEPIIKNPNLDLADLRYLYRNGFNKEEVKKQLLAAIKENYMVQFYEDLVAEFTWQEDEALRSEINKKANTKEMELEKAIADAEENAEDAKMRESLLQKAQFYSSVGHFRKAVLAYRKATEKTVGSGERLDIVFAMIRLGFFHDQKQFIVRNISKAKNLLEEASDWERKNRLKVYEALYFMSIRQIEKAANLLLETLSTFTSYELFNYEKFIFYTVITSIVSLDRTMLKKKVIDSPEVLSVMRNLPQVDCLLNSFYNSQYSQFLVALVDITDELKKDRLMGAHAEYFCREMRIRAYSQLLQSYKSVQLNTMASNFGVSPEFMDRELSRFIAAGRLHCKIDKVGGIVETNRPDSKNAQYQATIKQGDLLLNRIQKLSRVINV